VLKRISHLLEAIIVYLLYALFWALPMPIASAIGGALAKQIGPMLKAHQIAKKNIALALPELSQEQQTKTLLEMWENLGRTVAEFPHMRHMNKRNFQRYVNVVGSEHFTTLSEQKKNYIFYGGHFGNWETMPKATTVHGFPLALAYRHANNPYVDALIKWNRRTYQSGSIRKGTLGSRALLKAIRNLNGIGMLLDQKMNNGIPVPFFGKDAMTAPAVAKIALRLDCLIVPTTTRRVKGCHSEVVIFPPITVEKTDNEEQDIYNIMLSINQFFETHIRKYPGQWFWVHRRWPKEESSN
jgi:KDO2-lipid IV(A) lauroyltransferase